MFVLVGSGQNPQLLPDEYVMPFVPPCGKTIVGYSWTMKSGINPECAAATSRRCGLIHSKRVRKRISSLNLRLACYLQTVFNFLEFQKEQRLPKLCPLHKMGHMNKEVNFLCFVLLHYFLQTEKWKTSCSVDLKVLH